MKTKNPTTGKKIIIDYRMIDQKYMAGYIVEVYNAHGIPASTQRGLMLAAELTMLHVRRLQAEAKRILFHHTECDDKGVPKNYPKGPFTFKTPEAEKLHDQEMATLWSTRVEIPVAKIPIAHVEHAGFAGATLRGLDFIFDGVPPMPKETDGEILPPQVPCSNEPGTGASPDAQ